jgi:phenylalanyl-tRNA synthetase beta chain
MRISIEWLRDYVDVPEPPAQLKDDLTMIGLLVESLTESAGSPVLEIEITSNRPDCLGHYGVAREVAALYGRKLRPVRASRRLQVDRERTAYSIEISDPQLCPRYVGLVLDGIRVRPSPPWMQRRLEAAGMRPVNNVVDITNYVLLELGHPLHAFDFKLLRAGKIVVARAEKGQHFITLDGIGRELDEEMLLINDGAGPVAIAGVMGGLNSEITEQTDTVLLECAYFHPASVRRTSKKLGLSTEASYRFERGADWNGPVRAIARTAYLIQRLAGGRIAGNLRDVYPRQLEPRQIELRRERAEALLGVSLEESFIVSTLKNLHFKPARAGKKRWIVTCPTYRADVELEADLIEEVARFYGYQKIPVTLAPAASAGTASPAFRYEQGARRILLGLGYSEAVNLSFGDKDDFGMFAMHGTNPVRIQNPLTSDTEYLRVSLIPGLVRAARRNFNYDQPIVRLFEVGKIYDNGPDGPKERRALGILGTGSYTGINWHQSSEEYDYFHLKGVVCALLEGMRSAPFEIRPAKDLPWVNPMDASRLSLGGADIGILGSLHPALAQDLKLKSPVYVAELDFTELTLHVFEPERFTPLPKFPNAERDLSIVVPQDLSYQAVRSGILKLGIPELIRIELMDVYEGEQISAGKISMLLRLTFQDPEATLTVDRVQGFSDNIRNFLRDRFGADLR